ncbi:PucR family transcriptional regulator [Nonomuraea sp. NPDC050394]|uniref:PucR family transcriptional regulator n=1 Tax=Nonomuraea sp. NPDC050394 TaxID=3364363 RepID=UPI0037AD49AA
MSVRLIESLGEVVRQPPGAVLVLTRAASAQAVGYRLEVALRDAAAAGAVALVLTAATTISHSAWALAERVSVELLDTRASGTSPLGAVIATAFRESQGDLAGLMVAVQSALAGDAADSLARAARAVEGIAGAGGVPERIAEEVSAAMGVPVDPDFTTAGGPGGHRADATELVLRLAALAAAAGAVDELPARSRAHLLTELLVAPEKQAQELVPRARALGLPIDDWHVILRFEPVMDEGPDRYAVLDTLASRATRAVRELAGPSWNAALAGDALVIVRTVPRDQGSMGLRQAVREAGALLERVRPAGTKVRCGVSTCHEGVLGLRTCASEARTALRRDKTEPLAVYDLSGLDRMLEEWYSSDTAQQAVRDLLQPLLDLPGGQPKRLITILRAYLDHHGSPAKAAEEVNLHRNAVSRNIRRIETLLKADLNNPQQRLALQLACRAAQV